MFETGCPTSERISLGYVTEGLFGEALFFFDANMNGVLDYSTET